MEGGILPKTVPVHQAALHSILEECSITELTA
jgi:hypothetical protein